MTRLRIAILALLFVLAGCGSPAASTGTAKAPALTTIQVGIMPIPDCATIPWAEMSGYFEAEGLEIQRVIVQGGGAAVPKLESGNLQFSIMNYPAAVMAEQNKPDTLEIVADAYQAAPNTFKLMVPADSPIRRLEDLRGKRISVATLKSISTVTTKAALKVAGLTERDVKISEMALTDMIIALESGNTDAAWLTEPFITIYQSEHGGRELYDVMQGQTADLPVAGWATSTAYVKSNPAQVAAFHRAVTKAQLDVAHNDQIVRTTLLKYTKIDPAIAGTITLGVFPTSLHPPRIQKVADLMLEYEEIKTPVDVRKFLLPLPAITHTPAPPPSPSPSSPSGREAGTS